MAAMPVDAGRSLSFRAATAGRGKGDTVPLTPEATDQLEAFTLRMMGSRQAGDDDRFHAFVIACHRARVEADAEEISAFLASSVISNRFEADELIERYSHMYEMGRRLLAQYDPPVVARRG